MKRLSFTQIIIALTLSGCASTGVVPMSQDSFFIGKKDGAPGLGISLSNKAEVYKEANAFCAQKNQEVKVLRENVIPAKPGRLGSTELHFKCVSPGGTAKPLVRAEDKVINVNYNSTENTSKEKYEKLEKINELRALGIITEEEFEIEKKKILSE